MKIYRNQIPHDGIFLEGEVAGEILKPGEGVLRHIGPLRYRLDCGSTASGFWASGELILPVEMECVRCLRPFAMELHLSDFATQLEWETGDFVDLTPVFREDILLFLPNYPDCHRDGGLDCPGFGMAVFVTGTGKLAEPGEPGSGENPWNLLDSLDLKNCKS